jgi:MFS family permease
MEQTATTLAESMTTRFGNIGRALAHRNYRLFFAGQSISLIGSWITRVATSWLVYRLTGSAWTLGIVGFAGQFPTFLLAPVAGAWVDRWNRHKLLVGTQVLAALQSGILAWLALSGRITVGHVLALSVFQGVVNAFDMPARQSFIVDMIGSREDLPNAIALNSSMFNGARLVGPSVAGILIAWVGEGWCFFIDAVSYIAVIASLLLMRLSAPAMARRATSVVHEIVEGYRYVAGFSPIRVLLILLAVTSLLGFPYTVLMPIIVGNVLHGGPHTLGFLMAASGVGALAGALYLASRKSVLGLGRVIAWSAFGFGVGLVLFSLSRSVWLSMLLMAGCGLTMILQMAASNTVLQTLSDDDKRGRVMSFYSMAFFGTAPLGSLFAGAVATWIGAPRTILIGGAVCAIAALVFWRALPKIRQATIPIYTRLGILPAPTDQSV